jgi:hypothetical protein
MEGKRKIELSNSAFLIKGERNCRETLPCKTETTEALI